MTGVADGFMTGVADGFMTGVAFAAGDPVGEALAAGGGVPRIWTVADPTSCHSPLRLVKVSIERNCPLMFWVLPSAILYLPFVTTLRRLTTAELLSRTFTLISDTSHESADKAPDPMSVISRCLLPSEPSG